MTITRAKRDPGNPGFQSKISTHILKIEAGSQKVHYVLSGEAPDRYQDVIRQNGWQLDNFNNHPILLSSHEYRGLTNQIGEWSDLEVKGKGDSRRLEGMAKYYVGAGNKEADWGFFLAQQGKAAISVGFQPIEYKEREGFEDDWWPPLEFVKSELLEGSHVTVPAHPEALQLMVKSGEPVIRELALGMLKDLDQAREKLFTKEHGGPLTVRQLSGKTTLCIVKSDGESCSREPLSDSWPMCEMHSQLIFAKLLGEGEGNSTEDGDEEETENLFLEAIREGLLEEDEIDAEN